MWKGLFQPSTILVAPPHTAWFLFKPSVSRAQSFFFYIVIGSA